ncbi:hypothetical protein WA026_015357, partial [Henosepilachna vigintioctopunctata]
SFGCNSDDIGSLGKGHTEYYKQLSSSCRFQRFSPSQPKDDDDITLARMIRSSADEYDNVLLSQLVGQLQISTAAETRIEIEEFIGIDKNSAVCALATEKGIVVAAENYNRN